MKLKLYSIFDFYLHKTHTQTYKILVEKNGVAPKKSQPIRSTSLAGQKEHYIRMSCFFM